MLENKIAANHTVVSIIIPTYKDWTRLSLCLRALSAQTFPANQFEITVVNNHSNDMAPEWLFVPDNCTIIREVRPGSYAARNAALQKARGEIVGFTDSDCVPDKDWIKNAVSFLNENKGYSRIAGKIELFYKNDKLTPAELYEKVFAFKQEGLAKYGLSVTANMFSYKTVFDKVGVFRDELLSGGDWEWSKRAEKESFRISYCENVIIKHPARHSLEDLKRKFKRTAGGGNLGKAVALKRLLKGLIPPFKTVNKHLKRYGSDLSLIEKINVFLIHYWLVLLFRNETVKISFGKKRSRV